MSISVCQIYNDFQGSVNTWKGGHFRPLSFEYALHEAQMEIFNEKRREWEKSQVITDSLRPFVKRVQVPIKNFEQGGLIDYPVDYSSFLSVSFFTKLNGGKENSGGVLCKGVPILSDKKKCRPLREEEKEEAESVSGLIEKSITKIDNKRWTAVLEHRKIGPSISRPYCTQYDKGFIVAPHSINYAMLYYLSIPSRPKFIYHTGSRDKFICDKSPDLLWGEEMLPELMSRLKTKYASFVSNQQKYAEGTKETSNQ